jgi:hypothetical protein
MRAIDYFPRSAARSPRKFSPTLFSQTDQMAAQRIR